MFAFADETGNTAAIAPSGAPDGGKDDARAKAELAKIADRLK
jgi:hypothetical protein